MRDAPASTVLMLMMVVPGLRAGLRRRLQVLLGLGGEFFDAVGAAEEVGLSVVLMAVRGRFGDAHPTNRIGETRWGRRGFMLATLTHSDSLISGVWSRVKRLPNTDCPPAGAVYLSGHFATLFGAAAAAFGATKTVVVTHLLALDGAPVADFGTDATVLCRKAALAGHGAQTKVADLNTFPAAGRTLAAFHLIHLHHLAETILAIDEALLANSERILK